MFRPIMILSAVGKIILQFIMISVAVKRRCSEEKLGGQ